MRRRAISFIVALLSLGYTKTIPLDKAKELFSRITGLWDRTTLKAYFGTQQHKSTQKISRIARYGTGTYSFKNIELSQEVSTTKGYLEKMGVVEMERKGNTWFMNICSDAVLVPQLYESPQVFMGNISLSPNCVSECVESQKGNDGDVGSNILETNNNLQDEREKFYNIIINKAQNLACADNLAPTPVQNAATATVVRQNDSKESLKREGEG